MSDEPVSRVNYYDGQYLRVQEFTDEQQYHIGMRRRHNIGGHSWGVVRGLAMGLTDPGPDGNGGQGPFLDPGMAIDGYGRELIVVQRRPLDVTQFDRWDVDVLDVWLNYGQTQSDPAPPGYGDCDDPGSPPRLFDRLVEEPILSYEPAGTNPDRRRPLVVAAGDNPFGPQHTPPDDPEDFWPVFVGRFRRTAKPPLNSNQYVYQVDPTGRPYAGLVGESVVAPSGLALVQLGSISENDDPQAQAKAEVETALRRFAVYVAKSYPTTARKNAAGHPVRGPAPTCPAPDLTETDPRLAIDANGDVTLLGHTTLQGDLTVAGGAAEFTCPLPLPEDQKAQLSTASSPTRATQPTSSATAVPRPWTVYKSVESKSQETVAPTSTTTTPTAATASTPALASTTAPTSAPTPTPYLSELRVVIAGDQEGNTRAASETAPSNLFSVGFFSKDTNAFQAVLSVSNRGVQINGDLSVQGLVTAARGTSCGPLTPAAQAASTSAFTAGLVGSGNAPAGLSGTPLEMLAVMLNDPSGAGRVALQKFIADKKLYSPLITLLLETSDGVNALLGSFV